MVQYAGLPRINSVEYVVVDEVDACLMHHSGLVASGALGGKLSSSSSLSILLTKFLSPTYLEEEEYVDPLLFSLGQAAPKRKRRKFRTRQTVFCSATIPQHRYFLKQCKAQQWTLEEPVYVCTSPGEALPPTLKHAYMVCVSKEKKLATLRKMLQRVTIGGKAAVTKILIFCDASRPMEEMAQVIAHDIAGVYYQEGKQNVDNTTQAAVSTLRLEDSLSRRAGATNVFATAPPTFSSTISDTPNCFVRILLTADLAARGLDIEGISHVIHFDLPPDADTYLHRSGRAGRFGSSGQVVSILTPDQEFVLERLANALTLDMTCVGRQKVAKSNKGSL
jgi:superfamily II DNA/RNA helicase